MPLSRDIRKYPPEFIALAERFKTNTSRMTMGFRSPSAAKDWRFQLYGFKTALRAPIREGKEMRENPLADEYGNFLSTKMRVVGDYVEILMPEDADGIESLRQALRQDGILVPSSAATPARLIDPAELKLDMSDTTEENIEAFLKGTLKPDPLPAPVKSFDICKECNTPVQLPNFFCKGKHEGVEE